MYADRTQICGEAKPSAGATLAAPRRSERQLAGMSIATGFVASQQTLGTLSPCV
jgi:hypothetical protein